MAFDPGLAELLRDDLAGQPMRERPMFGGLCFLLDGNMVAGVLAAGAMIRVGAANEPAALALPGVRPMRHGGRPMTGFVLVDAETLADDGARARLLDLALGCVRGLPPK